jgi:quercetin dioxygenase-like cupin family protein
MTNQAAAGRDLRHRVRRFALEANGQTPLHSHPWEHEVYVLQGSGAVVPDEGETPVHPDCAVLVVPEEMHCFRAGEEGLQFLCLVPLGEATRGR